VEAEDIFKQYHLGFNLIDVRGKLKPIGFKIVAEIFTPFELVG
jgi:hypothetical protein